MPGGEQDAENTADAEDGDDPDEIVGLPEDDEDNLDPDEDPDEES